MTQTSIRNANTYSGDSSRRVHFPLHCVVKDIHFPGDPGNRSGRVIEYDVAPLMPGIGEIQHAILALGIQGLVDDDDIILSPGPLRVPPGNDSTTTSPGFDSDGDQVLVQFINGDSKNPVITHVLTHTQRGQKQVPDRYEQGSMEVLTKGPKDGGDSYQFGNGDPGKTEVHLEPRAGNRFRHTRMNGTHFAVDDRGDVFINFKRHPVFDKNQDQSGGEVWKKVVIQNEGHDLFKMFVTSGGVGISFVEGFPADDFSFTIGDDGAETSLVLRRAGGDWTLKIGDGAVKVAIADHLKTLYDSLKSAIENHTHLLTISAASGTGGTGTAATTSTTIPSWDPDIESTKVTIPDG